MLLRSHGASEWGVFIAAAANSYVFTAFFHHFPPLQCIGIEPPRKDIHSICQTGGVIVLIGMGDFGVNVG